MEKEELIIYLVFEDATDFTSNKIQYNWLFYCYWAFSNYFQFVIVVGGEELGGGGGGGGNSLCRIMLSQ